MVDPASRPTGEGAVRDRRTRNLVVVGASAGGVEALRELTAGLPPDLAAGVLVVLHLPAGGTSALPAILSRSGPLPAVAAEHGMAIEHGTIYVAPPDQHLLVADGVISLSHGPTENGHRPAINALFRSAAIVGGPRVIGMLLSGMLDDGVAGLVSVADRGGTTIVQNPADALYRAMPKNALETLSVDYVLPAGKIGAVLDRLTEEEVSSDAVPPPSAVMRLENEIASTNNPAQPGRDPARLGPMSGLTCPDCDGSLIEIEHGDRYRCRIGHAWTALALLEAQGTAWQHAIAIAVRTLDQKAALGGRMAQRARERGSIAIAARYDVLADEALDAARLLEKPLQSMQPADHAKPGTEAEEAAQRP